MTKGEHFRSGRNRNESHTHAKDSVVHKAVALLPPTLLESTVIEQSRILCTRPLGSSPCPTSHPEVGIFGRGLFLFGDVGLVGLGLRVELQQTLVGEREERSELVELERGEVARLEVDAVERRETLTRFGLSGLAEVFEQRPDAVGCGYIV